MAITILNKDQLAQLTLDWINGKNPQHADYLKLAGIELKEDSPAYIWEELNEIRQTVMHEAFHLVNPKNQTFDIAHVPRGSVIQALFDHDPKKNGTYVVKHVVINMARSPIVVTETFDEGMQMEVMFHIHFVQKVLKIGNGTYRPYVKRDDRFAFSNNRFTFDIRQSRNLPLNTHVHTDYDGRDYVENWLREQPRELQDLVSFSELLEAFQNQNWIKVEPQPAGSEFEHYPTVLTFPKKKAKAWLKANARRFKWTKKHEEEAARNYDDIMTSMYDEDLSDDEEPGEDLPEDTQCSSFGSSPHWD